MHSAYRRRVTKTNIHVHLVEIAVVCSVNALATARLGNYGVVPKRFRKLTDVGVFSITGDAEEFLVVVELSTARDFVQALGGAVGLFVGTIGDVT